MGRRRSCSDGETVAAAPRRDSEASAYLCSQVVRIVSLVPSATETLFALGLGSDVIAVTHECDYPPAARELPKITRDVLPERAERARDRRGGQGAHAGRRVDLRARRRAAARPAPRPDRHPGAVRGVRGLLRRRPRDRREDRDPPAAWSRSTRRRSARCWATSARWPRLTDRKDEAVDLIRDASARIDRVRLAIRGARRPRVAALEWLDPPFAAGHWTPQLIEYAGGDDVLGFAGEKSAGDDVADGRGRAARRGDRDAVRIRRRDRPPRGRDAPRRAGPRSAPARWSRSTRPPTSRGRARGSSTGSSCWRTSCTPSCFPRRPGRAGVHGRALTPV